MYLECKLLTHKEQEKLFKLMKKGDQSARSKLIESCLPLLQKIAAKYNRKGLNYTELVNEGCLGLINAVDKWEPKRGALSTVAYWAISNKLNEFVMHSKHGCIRVSIDAIRKINNGDETYKSLLHVADFSNGGGTKISGLTQEYEGTYIDYELIESLLDRLDPLEEKIIRARFGLGRPKITVKEIRKEFGFGKQNFSKLYLKIIEKLQEQV